MYIYLTFYTQNDNFYFYLRVSLLHGVVDKIVVGIGSFEMVHSRGMWLLLRRVLLARLVNVLTLPLCGVEALIDLLVPRRLHSMALVDDSSLEGLLFFQLNLLLQVRHVARRVFPFR